MMQMYGAAIDAVHIHCGRPVPVLLVVLDNWNHVI
jgi:hypothetical protein